MSEEDKVWFEKLLIVTSSGLEKRLDAKMKASQDDLIEMMRDIETTMLKEFQKWASNSDIRVRSHDAVLRAHGAQLETLEDRVAKLESKKQ